MIGKTISHYKILEKLGGGGMGVVYKAEDTKLDRFVALKFLPPSFSNDEDAKERFIHEAKAASALEHNNICNIHEIDDTEEGQLFIVMSNYEGETLKKKIEKEPLQINETIEIITQIAEGLSKAHEKGIVHRDIKPANIFITNDGTVKILDFGLAKSASRNTRTQLGSTMGTVAYMSPEQTRGDEVDHQTDIWSLGVVMYEMVTGELPFKGEYDQAIIYSILNEDIDLPSEIDPKISQVIQKCLNKNPEDRFQSATEILNELDFLREKSTTIKSQQTKVINSSKSKSSLKRILVPIGIIILLLIFLFLKPILFNTEESYEPINIAVIDFINETNETELNGLSGMLITALEQSKRLSVLTRSRMFDILKQLKISEIDRIDESLGRKICKEAKVNTLATATIRKFGKLYTIDFKVLNVNKNEYLFTSKEEGEGQESIPTMIDNLSENVRKGLKEKVSEIKASTTNIAEITSPNLEAYQHYFKGDEFIDKLRFDLAREEFIKAIKLDSTFGLAYYRLAYAINWELKPQLSAKYITKAISMINRIPEKERYLVRAEQAKIDKGFEAGIKILKEMEQLYPNVKEMLYNIGDWAYHDGDLFLAKEYLEKTLKMDPTFIRALQHLTWTYRDLGLYEKMFGVAERYMTVLDSEESNTLLAEAYMLTGEFETGIKLLKQLQELHPTRYSLYGSIAGIYSLQDKYNQAEKELNLLIKKDMPVETQRLGNKYLAGFYPYVGKYRESIDACDKMIDFYWQSRDTSSASYWQLAKGIIIAEGRNDKDAAWSEAEKTFPFQEQIDNLYYWITLPILYVHHDDFVLADSLAKSTVIKWWYLTIRSLIQAEQQECNKTESFADTELQMSPGFAKILVFYNLAECQYEEGQLDKSVKYLLQLQSIYDNSFSIRAMFYPKSFYLLGKIYEQKGDRSLALKYYTKFLEMWKNADEDLPELIDAKKRYTKLLGTN